MFPDRRGHRLQMFAKLSDLADRYIRLERSRGERGVRRVVALPNEYRRDAVAHQLLDGGQQAWLVVDHDVVRRGIRLLYRREHVFLVEIHVHPALDGIPEPGMTDLAGLEHD